MHYNKCRLLYIDILAPLCLDYSQRFLAEILKEAVTYTGHNITFSSINTFPILFCRNCTSLMKSSRRIIWRGLLAKTQLDMITELINQLFERKFKYRDMLGRAVASRCFYIVSNPDKNPGEKRWKMRWRQWSSN